MAAPWPRTTTSAVRTGTRPARAAQRRSRRERSPHRDADAGSAAGRRRRPHRSSGTHTGAGGRRVCAIRARLARLEDRATQPWPSSCVAQRLQACFDAVHGLVGSTLWTPLARGRAHARTAVRRQQAAASPQRLWLGPMWARREQLLAGCATPSESVVLLAGLWMIMCAGLQYRRVHALGRCGASALAALPAHTVAARAWPCRRSVLTRPRAAASPRTARTCARRSS